MSEKKVFNVNNIETANEIIEYFKGENERITIVIDGLLDVQDVLGWDAMIAAREKLHGEREMNSEKIRVAEKAIAYLKSKEGIKQSADITNLFRTFKHIYEPLTEEEKETYMKAYDEILTAYDIV